MHARLGACVLAIVLAWTGSASAQETTGTITGRVLDAQGLAVPGVSVTVTGPQGARTLTTDADGRYNAPLLVPGVYTVRAELTGFRAAEARNVNVVLGSTTTANLTLVVGAVTETVEVTAADTVVDVRSTTVGGVLDSEQLARLPIGRSLADTLYVVPGVSTSAGINSVGANANPSIGGSSGLENNYVIDGVNITDVGFGGFGAYNSIYGSLGTGVTSDFIKETEVKTAGFEAEYGQTTGGVINVITKSGGNQFTGSGFVYTRPSAFEAGWDEVVSPNGTVNTVGVDNHDGGVSVGGPIVQDRLFFFGTYNPQWQNRTFIAPEGFPFRSLGGVDRERTIHAYAGKLSGQFNSNHRLDFSLFGDPSKGHSGLQRQSELRRVAYPGVPGTTAIEGGFSELEYGSHQQTGRYDGILGSSWLVEANIANSTNKFIETPTVDEWRYDDLTQTPFGRTGGLGSLERNEGSNVQYGIKSTHFLSGAGQHEIRFGVQLQNIEFTRDFDYSGRNLVLGDGSNTITGGTIEIRPSSGGTFYRATRGKLVPTAPTFQDYTSFFIQDTWQVGRLTVRPGIRYERQYLEGIDPAGDNPDLCFSGDERPGEGTGIGDPIRCNFTWNNWAPRIGATYDLTGTGRAKVFGSWGRFYAMIPNDLAVRAMSADAGITRQDYFDAALTQPIPNGVSFGGTTSHLRYAGLHAAIIDPEAGSTYKNELLAGVEFDVLEDAALSVRYIRRTMPQILEDIGQLPLAAYFFPESLDTSVEYFITNVNASTQTVTCCGVPLASFEDPEHTYSAFEVAFNKRLSNSWSAIASYRFAKLEGNFEGFFRSDNTQSDPAITSLFDFPTNDPSYVELADVHGGLGDIRFQGCSLGCGKLPNDRPHQLKLYGNYLFRDFNVGFGFNAGSGMPLTALAGNPAYGNGGEIPMTIRGAGMETADGFRERTPFEATVDLHADYGFEFGGRRFLVLADVFNLFNRQIALDYDNWFERTPGTLNPNFGQPVNGGNGSTSSLQAPLSVRFGARFDW
jgi:hypothetical protein